jgi:hypothetical protein
LRNKTQGQNSVNLSISSDKQYALWNSGSGISDQTGEEGILSTP